ncbi:MAG TPA: hypothetical protein VFH80_33235 [Solirubrobacteraceae bacterium]|nr:hypothetical protein [Solirubrobacteraceae bacterium]
MSGYTEGPTLHHNEQPWPSNWEQRVDETCAHEWERCTLLADGPHRSPVHDGEHVVRCRLCSVPRCGHSDAADPCMERRHHDGVHVHLSGKFEPLGGLPDHFIDWGTA